MARRRSTSALQLMTDLSLEAPQVVAQRLWYVAARVPSGANRRELTRMSTEKWQAVGEAWWAMGWAMLEWQQRAWRGIWMTGGTAPPPWWPDAAAVDRVLAAGLRPARRKVLANRRRLARG